MNTPLLLSALILRILFDHCMHPNYSQEVSNVSSDYAAYSTSSSEPDELWGN